jgi:adenine-specific DNA-methyltransferase
MQNLLPDYKGKIDVMPIDPPYNTNISGIGYLDYDSQWLDFMKQRLILAKELLSEKGVMFIHIDECEFPSLYNLCASIFGYDNLMSMIWKKTNEIFDKNRKEKPLESGVRRTHEFVVVCFKNRAKTVLNPINQLCLVNGELIEIEKPLETILDFMGTTSSAKDEIEALLGDRNIFSTPKPVKLIKELIRSTTDKNSIVMDFFAGSGTTGHATMELNKEDGGERKFILITNNESNICQKVTIPRIKAAMKLNCVSEKEIDIKL